MKSSFTADVLLNWIDKTRAEVVVGPDVAAPQRTFTTAEVNEAWARSADNVLNMLEEFVKRG